MNAGVGSARIAGDKKALLPARPGPHAQGRAMHPASDPNSLSLAKVLWVLLIAATVSAGCSEGDGLQRTPLPRNGGLRWLAAGATRLPTDAVTVPFDMVIGRPEVIARINGKGPYRLLLDTGAECLVVSRELADELRLPEQPARYRIARDVTDKRQDVQHAHFRRTRSLQLGDATLQDVGTLTLERRTISRQGRVDGIVGLGVFNDCLLTIDYPARRLVLSRGRLPAADGRELLQVLRSPNGSNLWVPCDVSGRPVRLLIDSGWSGLTGAIQLNRKDASGLSFAYGPVGSPIDNVDFFGAVRKDAIGRLAGEMRVGRFTFSSPIVEVTSDISKMPASVLNLFTVTIDQRSMVVRFAGPGDEPITCGPLRHLAFNCSSSDGAWVVKRAVAGESLDALGLREGDRITMVDGTAVADRGINELVPPDETTMTCTVERDGRQLQVRVPVIVDVP